MSPATPPPAGQSLGQDTQFQAGKEAPRRDAAQEKRRKAAAECRAQAECPEAAESLTRLPPPATRVQHSRESAEQVIAATRTWLEKAVIGLQLCPFASGPYLNDRVRYCVSEKGSGDGLLDDLACELQALQASDPLQCETTLLIHPLAFTQFSDYNEFLGDCEDAVRRLGFEGELQVASFHPSYQFAAAGADDIENYSNRSPYPMLHLLREVSITRAVASFPGVNDIGTRNMQTLQRLGHEGWRRLWLV